MSTLMQHQVACNATTGTVTFYATLSNENIQLKKLGDWVKKHRVKMNFSQETAAEKIGMSRYQWIRIENGQSGTKRETIIKIAKELKADETEGLTLLAGLKMDNSPFPKKPTNVAEFFEIVGSLGMDVQFAGGIKTLETLDADELQELLDGMLANASAKARRKLQSK